MLSTDVMQCALLSHYVKFQVEVTAQGCYNPSYDDKKETAKTAEFLVSFPEDERFYAIVASIVTKNPVMAMLIAKRCLKQEDYFRTIVKQGFPYLGSAQLRYWIPQGFLFLGEDELLSVIEINYPENSDMRQLAMYHFRIDAKRPEKWRRYE